MNMLESAQAMIARAAQKLDWNNKKLDEFLTPEAVHDFTIEVDGDIHRAYRVQHSNVRGPFKGGIRFHPRVTKDEVQALATLMSVKSAAVGIPMGGGKGGVAFEPREHDDQYIERVARAYARELKDVIGPDKDVPAPDVNTNGKIIDWMVDEFERLSGDTSKAAFTGKTLENGGSEGRVEATGRGGMIALREYLKAHDIDPHNLTVAVQGIGNVGFYFAKLVEKELGVKVVAVANSKHTYSDEKGLGFAGRVFSRQLADELVHDGASVDASSAVLSYEADVLVLAAFEGVISADNQAKVHADIVLELANGPIDDAALTELEAREVHVIPDVVANAGGVAVSYLEWEQNRRGEHWSEAIVNQKLENIMVTAMATIMKRAKAEGCPLKEAAFMVALERIG